MEISAGLSLSQKQQLKLSPQLIQSFELMTLPLQELQARIQTRSRRIRHSTYRKAKRFPSTHMQMPSFGPRTQERTTIIAILPAMAPMYSIRTLLRDLSIHPYPTMARAEGTTKRPQTGNSSSSRELYRARRRCRNI
jgi:hypothetical protein